MSAEILEDGSVAMMTEEEKREQKEGMHQFFAVDRVNLRVDREDLAIFSFFYNMCFDDNAKDRQRCEKEALAKSSQFVLGKNWHKIRKNIKEVCEFNAGKTLEPGEVMVDPPKVKKKRKPSKYQMFIKECMNRPQNKAKMIGKRPGDPGGASHVMKDICVPEWHKIKGKK